MSSLPPAEDGSAIDRVRARVTKMMHLARDRHVAPPAPAPVTVRRPSGMRPEPLPSGPVSLADALHALQATVRETDELIRKGWELAVDLNEVRRLCARCEAAGPLCEAIGSYQTLLNRWRRNEQAAARALNGMARGIEPARPGVASVG